MKYVEFSTPRGHFVLVDMSTHPMMNYGQSPEDCNKETSWSWKELLGFEVEGFGLLRSITEEQASTIVDFTLQGRYKDALLSILHSMEHVCLYSNPLGTNDDTGHNARDREWRELEEKTYRHPFLLKRLTILDKIEQYDVLEEEIKELLYPEVYRKYESGELNRGHLPKKPAKDGVFINDFFIYGKSVAVNIEIDWGADCNDRDQLMIDPLTLKVL